MVTKSCPIKELNSCPCHKEDIYYLEDINKNKYRILHNNCLTHIMHCKKINYLDKLDYYKSIKVRSFRLELLMRKLSRGNYLIEQNKEVAERNEISY